MSTETHIIDRLRENGHRITLLRRAIIRALAHASSPVTIAELAQMLRRRDTDANTTTFYREIAFLQKEGIVRELHFGERMKRYELMPDEHRHHLICTRCKKIEDVVLDHDLDEVEARVRRQTTFKVKDHALEFYGLCEKCQ